MRSAAPWASLPELTLMAVLVAVSSAFVCIGVFVAWLQYRASNRHVRQERTLHLDQSIDSLNAVRVRVDRKFPHTLTAIDKADVDRAATASSNADFELELRGLLARLEILCLAVSSGMADEDFAFELLGSTIVWYGTAFLPYFKTIRSTNVQPLLYADLQAVARRWEPRLRAEEAAFAATDLPYFSRSSRSQRVTLRQAAALPIDVPAVTTSIGASAGAAVPPKDVAGPLRFDAVPPSCEVHGPGSIADL